MSSMKTRFPLVVPTLRSGKFAEVVTFLQHSHEDAPRAAQVKPDAWHTYVH